MSDPGFRVLAERPLLAGPVSSMVELDVEGPDGAKFRRQVVRHPGAACVVPLLDDGRVVLVRQYRASIDELLLELPAGKLDVAGEAPEAAAARELEEEIGKRAGKLERLARFYNTPGFTDERGILYLATELSDGSAAPHGPEEPRVDRHRLVRAAWALATRREEEEEEHEGRQQHRRPELGLDGALRRDGRRKRQPRRG